MLQRFNLQEPVPVPRQKPIFVGRDWEEGDTFLPVESRRVSTTDRLVITIRCENPCCGLRDQERAIGLGYGKHDFLDMPDTLCVCGQEMAIPKFSVAQSHLKVDFVEVFNNAKKKRIEKVFNGMHKTMIFHTPGHFNQMYLHLSPHEFAPPTPKKKAPQALILSVEKGRAGAAKEQEHARLFFQEQGFEVKVVPNPSAPQMASELQSLASRVSGDKLCAVALMAHGSEGRITASDGQRVPLAEIFGFLDASNRKLVHVAKFFFVQACRGSGAPLIAPPGGQFDAEFDADPSEFVPPKAANFHWCYAATPGLPAVRGKMFEALSTASKEHRGAGLSQVCRHANRIMYHQELLMIVNDTLIDQGVF